MGALLRQGFRGHPSRGESSSWRHSRLDRRVAVPSEAPRSEGWWTRLAFDTHREPLKDLRKHWPELLKVPALTLRSKAIGAEPNRGRERPSDPNTQGSSGRRQGQHRALRPVNLKRFIRHKHPIGPIYVGFRNRTAPHQGTKSDHSDEIPALMVYDRRFGERGYPSPRTRNRNQAT